MKAVRLARTLWFEAELLPTLRQRAARAVGHA
jgi:hypothetical protein